MPDDDNISVGGRRGAAVWIGGVRGFGLVEFDRSHPNLPAIAAVETIEAATSAFVFGKGDEDAPIGNDRAAVAGRGKGHFPLDVLVGAPGRREIGLS